MVKPQILVVDNEPDIRKLLRLHLHNAGMDTLEAASGRDALSLFEHYKIDLILLDLMMEDINGWEVLHNMQSHHNSTPIIVLSARNLVSDKIETLGLGADDYVTKPFSIGELVARIQATLRRVNPSLQGTQIRCGTLVYDRTIQQLEKPTRTISLSPIEGVMLELLMGSPGRVFTKAEIFRHVWKLDQEDEHSVKVYINLLRKKVEDDPAQPQYIQTIRGIGYRFVGERS